MFSLKAVPLQTLITNNITKTRKDNIINIKINGEQQKYFSAT